MLKRRKIASIFSSFGFFYIWLFIPKHKMAKPFCVFKTLTGFGF
jgi:hypothetical protein